MAAAWDDIRSGAPAARPAGWLTVLSAVLSVLAVGIVAVKLSALNWRYIATLVPASPAFWLALAGYYLANPAGDWIIFRRLWPMPAGGFAALLRKQVYNELVLGYLGETYFYSWARRQAGLTDTPFGAVKDVAILSALAGNLMAVVLVVALWPVVGGAMLGAGAHEIYWSLGLVMLVTLGLMLARRRVFSLAPRDLRATFALHLLRICGKTALSALMWHLVLPDVALVWWLYLATLRQLVSRLPLISNKDLIFAGLALVILGRQHDIAAVMAMTAALLLAAHLLVAAILAKGELLRLLRGSARQAAAP